VRLLHDPPKISALFDDPNLVSQAGLVPVIGLAEATPGPRRNHPSGPHQRGRPAGPPRPRAPDPAPAAGLAPQARMDEPVPRGLRTPGGPGGLTSPDQVTPRSPRPSHPEPRPPVTKLDKPPNQSAATQPRSHDPQADTPRGNSRNDHSVESGGGSRLSGVTRRSGDLSSAMSMGPAFRQWLGTGVAAADDGWLPGAWSTLTVVSPA
jgi:hypothetical protein